MAETSAATGVPERALQAYAGSVIAMQHLLPECNIGWNTLAAVGYVESRHGTYNGSTMDADGLVSPTILGPLLDGTIYGEIRDTDGGALDGDTTWDRAVGPLQFIPSTWAGSGHDGDDNLRDHAERHRRCGVHRGALPVRRRGRRHARPGQRGGRRSRRTTPRPRYAIAVAKAANRYAAAVEVSRQSGAERAGRCSSAR